MSRKQSAPGSMKSCLRCGKEFYCFAYLDRKYCSSACYNAERAFDFWAKLDKNAPGGCWIWTEFLNHDGYGRVAPKPPLHQGKRAHRMAWELTHGDIPAGLYVMHKCDVRACCNPDHLQLGTQQDNISDMKAKGRGPTGAAQITRRKLTDDQVRYIRANYRKTGPRTGNGSELARQIGISAGMVHRIGRGLNWKHVK